MGVLKVQPPRNFSLFKEQELVVLCFEAFGTACKVKFSPLDSINHESASQKIVSWVHCFEERYSRYLPESWLSKINEAAGKYSLKCTPEDFQLLQAATFSNFHSQGVIDPSCLPLTKLWQEAKRIGQIPEESKIQHAVELVSWEKVQFSKDEIFLPLQGMGLDFGGFGKEFAVDKVAEILKSISCENFLVDFGGDLFASGSASEHCSWKVGIERTGGSERPAFVIFLKDHALATSGNYRKFFDFRGRRYGHTIDCRTGYPTIYSERSASVISPSCLKSGVLSTTSLMIGKQEALQLLNSEWNVEGCIQSFESSQLTDKFYKYIVHENLL